MTIVSKNIKGVQFEVLTSETLLRLSQIQVIKGVAWNMSSQGIQQEKAGVLDLALGLSSRQGRCTTCGLDYVKCQGHFGHILLSVPLFHPGYYKHIAAILQRICWTCGKVLYSGSTQLTKQQQLVICPHCHENVHPVFASSEDRMLLTPQYVFDVFCKIRDEELQLLSSILKNNRPESLILTVLPVPPACIRPSIIESVGPHAELASRTHEDDITSALVQILVHNNNISTSLNQGNDGLYKSWFAMQEQLNSMVGITQPKTSFYNLLNITSPGQMLSDEVEDAYDEGIIEGQKKAKSSTEKETPSGHRFSKMHESNRPTKTILNKLSGKYGRFRGNLSGKRVDFSGRSVISPDPDLRVDEIGIPYAVSRILTYPEVVNETNMEWINELIRNDQVDHVEKHGAFTPVQYLKPKGNLNQFKQIQQHSEYNTEKVETDTLDIKYDFDCAHICQIPWYEYEFQHFGVDYKVDGILIQQRKQQDITQFNKNIQVKHKNQNARQNYLQTFTHSTRLEHTQNFSFQAGQMLNQDQNIKNQSKNFQITNTESQIDFQKIGEEGFSTTAQDAAYRFISVPTTTLLNAQRQVDLQPGDIVHRFLQDGDPVLFNRQPSLHKASIACFRARIHQRKSFSFNVANCPNFGSDYDGDEMNIHYLQGVEARAEVDSLIQHADNLVDNATGGLSMQIMQDAISGIYILTHEAFMSFQQYVNYILVDWQALNSSYGYLGWPEDEKINKVQHKNKNKTNNSNDFFECFYGGSRSHIASSHIEQPAILYPQQLYTGTQLVSQVLWNHTQDNPISFKLDKDDVCVVNSRIMRGNINKKLVGTIFTELLENKVLNLGNRKTLENQVIDLIYSLQRVSLRYMRASGFSIGINDVWEAPSMIIAKKRKIIHSLYRLGFRRFSQVQYLWRYPAMHDCVYGDIDDILRYCQQTDGMNLPEEFLSQASMESELSQKGVEGVDVELQPSQIQSLLSDLREQLSEELLGNISEYHNYYNNSVLIMSRSGSKGSIINQVQMTSLLSQQQVAGAMIQPTYGGRTTPHFTREKLHNPFQFGFVGNSFFSGLQPYEFLFHTASGREGVIDTAIKTSSTGYIQRKLLKSLESAYVDWNNNVVCGRLVHFSKLFAAEDAVVNELYNQKLENFVKKQLDIILTSHVRQGSDECSKSKKQQQNDENQPIKRENVLKETQKLINQVYYDINPSHQEKQIILQVLSDYLEKNNTNISLPEQLRPQFTLYKLKQLIKSIRYHINIPKRWIEPYTPVGALAGQSLGEPTTQMTLKTFHFAGLASKIQGVPRLIQIFNAAKTARGGMFIYPRIQYKEKIQQQLQYKGQQAKLKDLNIYGAVQEDKHVYHDSETQAQYLKRQIEPTYLEEISTIKFIYNPSIIAIHIELDLEKIKNMFLQVTVKQIKEQIMKQIKVAKISTENITELGPSDLQISGFDSMSISSGRSKGNQDKLVNIQQSKAINILEALQKVLVSGLAECEVVVDQYSYSAEMKSERFQLYIQNQHMFDANQRVEELTPLEDTQYYLYTQTPQKPLQLFNNPTVDPYLSYTQSIHIISNIFGIEAARYSIVNEIHQLYKDYGMNICRYHIDLLGSFMTVTGNIFGFTNMGLKQLKKDRTIVLASFERTGEYLFEAGIKGVEETFNDVSEDLIFGNCVKVGSGLVKLEWEDGDFAAQTGRPW